MVALRKLQMGVMPDVEEQLSSFLGMPSTCRKSVLAPLDNIKELNLQWVLMPKLDSRGCIQVRRVLYEAHPSCMGSYIICATRDQSCHTQLAKMSFEETLGITAGVFFLNQ